jgi:hypothetical protein
VQPQHFARLGNFQDKSLTFCRVDREFHATFTKHVNAAGWLSFNEEYGSARIGGRKFYLFEGFESSRGNAQKKLSDRNLQIMQFSTS